MHNKIKKGLLLSVSNFSKSVLAIFLILPMLLPIQPAFANRIGAIASSTSQSPGDIGWSARFTVNGTDDNVQVVAVDGSKVYIAGYFTIVGGVFANNIAAWDGSTWSNLGSGLDGWVNALAVDGRGNLYAGGTFTHAGGKPATNIARWNGRDWKALGSGVDGNIAAISVDAAGNVYACGRFDHAGGIEAHNIAKWDGISWSNLKGKTSSTIDPGYDSISAITIDRFGYVYVGGWFTQVDGKTVNSIARWDGSNWSALGDGVFLKSKSYEGAVYSLSADNRGNIYAGGLFETAGGIPASNLARWNGESWSEVDGGINYGSNPIPPVISIVADGGIVYVGGVFTTTEGNPAGSIARWNGADWDNMQGGVAREGHLGNINSMAIDRDGRIFAVGVFSLAGGKCANNVAVWDGLKWSGLGKDTSVDGAINTMISDHHGGYYMAGDFVCAGGQVVNHIAHWDGATWSPLGGGLPSVLAQSSNPTALVLDHNDNLYVAGNFFQAGNIQTNGIAKWNGTDWEAVGVEDHLSTYALAVDNQNRLYSGGFFSTPGTSPPFHNAITRWNGSAWEDIGQGLFDFVYALAIDSQGRLVAGGRFTPADGGAIHGVARWDGQSWEALDFGFQSIPDVLLIDGDTIYCGGLTIWKIQNGTSEVLGGGVSSSTPNYRAVSALALDQKGRLVIGGHFTKAGSVNALNIARWDGQRWEALGSGIGDGQVKSLTYDANGGLLVAGHFSQAGGKVNHNLAIWIDPTYIWWPFVSR
jgi:hypothetical protein